MPNVIPLICGIVIIISAIVFILIVYSYKKNRTIPWVGEFAKRGYFNARFKVWNILEAQAKQKGNKYLNMLFFAYFKAKTSFFYYLCLLFRSTHDSFILMNSDVERRSIARPKFYQHLLSEKKATTLSLFALAFLILINITSGTLVYLTNNFPGIWAAETLVHDTYTEFEAGTYDNGITTLNDSIKLVIPSISQSSSSEFSEGTVVSGGTPPLLNTTSEPGTILPQQVPNIGWDDDGISYVNYDFDNFINATRFDDSSVVVFSNSENTVTAAKVYDDQSRTSETIVATSSEYTYAYYISYLSSATNNRALVFYANKGAGDQLYSQILDSDLNPSGTYHLISNGASSNQKATIVSDTEAIITWIDQASSNIIARKFSLTSGLPTSGIVNIEGVSADIQNLNIVPDDNGGAIISWADNRDTNLKVWAQKVNSSMATQWTANGRLVISLDNIPFYDPWISYQHNMQMVIDGAGGAFILTQANYGTFEYDYHRFGTAFVTRIDSSGNIPSGFNTNLYLYDTDLTDVTGVPMRANSSANSVITYDGNGGAVVAWKDRKLGASFLVMAQRVDRDGNYSWPEEGVFVDFDYNFDAGGLVLDVAPDGNGNAYVLYTIEQIFQNSYDLRINKIDLDTGAVLFASTIYGGGNYDDYYGFKSLIPLSDSELMIVNKNYNNTLELRMSLIKTETRYDTGIYRSYVSNLIDVSDMDISNINVEGDGNIVIETRSYNNLALNKYATSSSYQYSSSTSPFFNWMTREYTADNITDGREANFFGGYEKGQATAWIQSFEPENNGDIPPEELPQWVVIDLEQATTVGYMEISYAHRQFILPSYSDTYKSADLHILSCPDLDCAYGNLWEERTYTEIPITSIMSLDGGAFRYGYEFTPFEARYIFIRSDAITDTFGHGEVPMVIHEAEVFTSQDDAFQGWETVGTNGEINSEVKDYLQYRITLLNTSSTTPYEELSKVREVMLSSGGTPVSTSSSYFYTSPIIDAGFGKYGTTWDSVVLDQTLPAGTSIELAYRYGNTLLWPDDNWTLWSTTTEENLPDFTARYFQYRVKLHTEDIGTTPEINSVSINYDPLPGDWDENENDLLPNAILESTATEFREGVEEFASGTIDHLRLTDDGLIVGLTPVEEWLNTPFTNHSLSDFVNSKPYLADDSHEGVFTGWYDYDSFFINHIISDGSIDSRWPDDGIQIPVNTIDFDNTYLVSDYDEGAYFVYRSSSDDIEAIRIASSSTVHPEWPSDTIQIASTSWYSDLHTVADKNNGFVSSYYDGSISGITLQKISPIGERLWPSTQISLTGQQNDLALDLSNNTFIVYASNTSNVLMAQKIDSDGNLQWNGSAGVKVATSTEFNSANIKIIGDEIGGAYIIYLWDDPDSDNFELRLTHINSSGAKDWTKTIDTHDEDDSVFFGKVNGDNNLYLVFYKNNMQTSGAQYISPTGELLWGEEPVTLSPNNLSIPFGIDVDADGNLIVYLGEIDSVESLIYNFGFYIQKVNPELEYLYGNKGVRIDGFTYNDPGPPKAASLFNTGNNTLTLAYYTQGTEQMDFTVKNFSEDYAASGTLLSQYLDAGSTTDWGDIDYTITGNGNVSFRTRTIPDLITNMTQYPGVSVDVSDYNDLILGAGNADPNILINEVYEWPVGGSVMTPSPWIVQFGGNDWVEINFGELTEIGSLKVSFCEYLGYSIFTPSFEIQTCNESINDCSSSTGIWETQATVAGNTEYSVSLDFEPVQATKVRWRTNTYDTGFLLPATCVGEIEVFAGPAYTWSEWSDVNSPISSPAGRYLQYEATLENLESDGSPILEEVVITNSSFDTSDSVTSVFDSESDETVWKGIYASSTMPDDTYIIFATRVGNTSTPDSTWTEWASTTFAIAGQVGRYIQYRATLYSNEYQSASPLLDTIVIAYVGGTTDDDDDDDEDDDNQGGGGKNSLPAIIAPDLGEIDGGFSISIASPANFSTTPPQVPVGNLNLSLVGGPDTTYMVVSTNAGFSLSNIIPYSTTASILIPTPGIYTVYAKFMNMYGSFSPTVSTEVEIIGEAIVAPEETIEPEEIIVPEDEIIVPEDDVITKETEPAGQPEEGIITEIINQEPEEETKVDQIDTQTGTESVETPVDQGSESDLSDITGVSDYTPVIANDTFFASLFQGFYGQGARPDGFDGILFDTGVIARKIVETAKPAYQAGQKVAKTEEAKTANNAATTALVAVTTLQLAVVIDTLSQLPYLLFNLITSLLSKLLQSKLRGKVYNMKTGQPVAMAKVSLLHEGKVISTKYTDKYGSYFFLVNEGDYKIMVDKAGYTLLGENELEKIRTVYEETSYIKDKPLHFGNDDILGVGIPIKQIYEKSFTKFMNKHSIHLILSLLFWAGLAYSTAMTIFDPNRINLTITGVYVALFAFRVANLVKPTWGLVTSLEGKIAPFSVVEVYRDIDTSLAARTVSDEHGRYAFIMDKGKYNIKVRTPEQKMGEKELTVKKRRLVDEKIEVN